MYTHILRRDARLTRDDRSRNPIQLTSRSDTTSGWMERVRGGRQARGEDTVNSSGKGFHETETAMGIANQLPQERERERDNFEQLVPGHVISRSFFVLRPSGGVHALYARDIEIGLPD